MKLSRNPNITEKKIEFHGKSRTLGEYYLLDSVARLGEYDSSIVVELTLKGLYGYHLVNSFTPSLLIYLICYATLFLPIKDFNERLMVSMTALLVIAALFTQASNASVRTSYFKYLDIWFVVLIAFCFLLVIFNIWLHKIYNENIDHLASRQKSTYEAVPQEENSKTLPYFQTAQYYNLVFRILFAVFLFIFCVLFCCAAMEII